MRKVFISVPMNGMSDELIEDEIRRAKEYLKFVCPNEEFEYVDNLIPVPESFEGIESLYCIGKAIEKIAECEIVMAPNWELSDYYAGCNIEKIAAERYGLYVIDIPVDLLPEARDKMRQSFGIRSDNNY